MGGGIGVFAGVKAEEQGQEDDVYQIFGEDKVPTVHFVHQKKGELL